MTFVRLVPLLTAFFLTCENVEGFFTACPPPALRFQRTEKRTISHLSSSGENKGDIPPAFSIVDDGDHDNDSRKRKGKEIRYQPPEFAIERKNDVDSGSTSRPKQKRLSPRSVTVQHDEHDFYSSGDNTAVRPRRPRRPKKMRMTNWMEKNEEFTSQHNRFEHGPAVAASTPRLEESTSRPKHPPRTRTSPSDGTKTFRQDFRGTRVFVQGIPSGVSWQDLKDHFRVAGDVVFASVSVDLESGVSKGHGIVQFETTEMAQKAINIMRENPLNGEQLFVREDHQENRNGNARLGAPKRRSPPNAWKCANEDDIAYIEEGEFTLIKSLIKARDDARKQKKYDVSDKIREELKENHRVLVDDRLKMWWTAADGRHVPKTIRDIKGEGRWKLKAWRQIPTTPENDACVDPDIVEGLLKQRDIARREKDFGTADALLEEARTSPDGDLNLRIHDESRTWRIWTEALPPRPVEHRISRDPIDARKDAAKECIKIVEEFAPQKLDEIVMLLNKFRGREFQMLKRLKKQYL